MDEQPTVTTCSNSANAALDPANSPVAFLEGIYDLVKRNEVEAATDRVFDHIDRLLCDGAFAACDKILREVDVEQLSTVSLPPRKTTCHREERSTRPSNAR
jgi:hypothetical protein